MVEKSSQHAEEASQQGAGCSEATAAAAGNSSQQKADFTVAAAAAAGNSSRQGALGILEEFCAALEEILAAQVVDGSRDV